MKKIIWFCAQNQVICEEKTKVQTANEENEHNVNGKPMGDYFMYAKKGSSRQKWWKAPPETNANFSSVE